MTTFINSSNTKKGNTLFIVKPWNFTIGAKRDSDVDTFYVEEVKVRSMGKREAKLTLGEEFDYRSNFYSDSNGNFFIIAWNGQPAFCFACRTLDGVEAIVNSYRDSEKASTIDRTNERYDVKLATRISQYKVEFSEILIKNY